MQMAAQVLLITSLTFSVCILWSIFRRSPQRTRRRTVKMLPATFAQAAARVPPSDVSADLLRPTGEKTNSDVPGISGRKKRRRKKRTGRRNECISQSGAELCAKSPWGPPLLKAISSQNECGSTIGLALISIHLAWLSVEPAGAAAGGVGVEQEMEILTDGEKWQRI